MSSRRSRSIATAPTHTSGRSGAVSAGVAVGSSGSCASGVAPAGALRPFEIEVDRQESGLHSECFEKVLCLACAGKGERISTGTAPLAAPRQRRIQEGLTGTNRTGVRVDRELFNRGDTVTVEECPDRRERPAEECSAGFDDLEEHVVGTCRVEQRAGGAVGPIRQEQTTSTLGGEFLDDRAPKRFQSGRPVKIISVGVADMKVHRGVLGGAGGGEPDEGR